MPYSVEHGALAKLGVVSKGFSDERNGGYVAGGVGAGGALGGGAYISRKQPVRSLPMTQARRASADRIAQVGRGNTAMIDLRDLDQFRRGPGVRIKDYEHTVGLSHYMRNGGELPPVTVRIAGGQPFIRDGMHRVNAAHMAGLRQIPVRIETEDSLWNVRWPEKYNRFTQKYQRSVPTYVPDSEARRIAGQKRSSIISRHNAKKGLNRRTVNALKVPFIRI